MNSIRHILYQIRKDAFVWFFFKNYFLTLWLKKKQIDDSIRCGFFESEN